MKKLLLSLAALVGVSAFAHAEGTKLVMQEVYKIEATGSAPETKTVGDYTITLKKNNGSNAPACNKAGDVRLYAKNTITIASSGADLTSLVFELSDQGKKQYAAITASVGAVGAQAKGDEQVSWTGSAKEVTFTVGDTNEYGSADKKAGQFDFNSITINGDGGGTVTPTDRVDVASVEAFLGVAAGTEVKFTSPVNVVYQNGMNLYVEDATGGMFIYGTTNQAYNRGDVIPAGFEGKYTDYKGCIKFEIPKDVDGKFAAASGTAEVNPAEWTLEDISTDIQNQYVIVKGVSVEEAADGLVMTQNGAELVIYDKFKINVATGENLNVTGLVAVFDNALQFYPLVVTDAGGSVVEAVAAPKFSVAAGAVEEGTTVEITCETEGATIHYTTDGTEPTEASAKYAEAIVVDKAMTIKAIAVKEGLTNSVVVSAEYTVLAKPTGVALVFNFEDPSTLNPSYSKDVPADVAGVANFPGMADDTFNDKTNGYFYVVTDTELKSGSVTLTTNKGTTDARLYYSISAQKWGYRAYKKSTMKISVPTGFAITGLHFEGNKVTNEICDKVEYAGTKGDATWTAPEGEPISTLEFSNSAGTATFNKMTVYVVDMSGVEGVVAENADAEVEYFNLQGVKVVNPENGLYIRRQGGKVEKVVIR